MGQQINHWLAYRRAPSSATASAFVPQQQQPTSRYSSHSLCSNLSAMPDEWEAYDRYAHSDSGSHEDALEYDGAHARHHESELNMGISMGSRQIFAPAGSALDSTDPRFIMQHAPRPPGGLLYLKHFFPERERPRVLEDVACSIFGLAFKPPTPHHTPPPRRQHGAHDERKTPDGKIHSPPSPRSCTAVPYAAIYSCVKSRDCDVCA